MKHEVKAGMTDYTALVYVPDPASTDGSGKTGLVAANLTVSYVRVETDNNVTVTDATSSLNDLANLTATHADWGVCEVSNTLAPGLYRLDMADAVFATGAWSAVVYVMLTSSAAAASPMEFVMVPDAPLTGVNVSQLGGVTQSATDLKDFADDGYDPSTNKVQGVVLTDTLTTYSGNTVQSGDSFARMGATGSGLSTLATQASVNTIDDFLDTEILAIKAQTDLLPASPAAVGSAMTLTSGERDSVADALLKRDWTAVTGEAARSVLNALRFLRNKWSVSGTELTVCKEDDTATAWQAALTTDGAAEPVTASDPT